MSPMSTAFPLSWLPTAEAPWFGLIASPSEALAAFVFLLALIHTFCAHGFEHLAHRQTKHAGLWHLLGEVEIAFGVWAMVLIAALMLIEGRSTTLGYLESRSFTEPLFVFAIMVVAASRPIVGLVARLLERLVSVLPGPPATLRYLLVMSVLPLTGSLITEPAAMTLAALTLSRTVFVKTTSARFAYATLATLFVNVSIGGVLTAYAAPPVLMVAATWGWDTVFMLSHFGWKGVIAVVINTAIITVCFRKTLAAIDEAKATTAGVQLSPASDGGDLMKAPPLMISVVHVALLVGIIAFAHQPPVFLAFLLLFLGVATAYPEQQSRLLLREGLLIAFFLAGLVVLGGKQQGWLTPLISALSADTLYMGTAVMTAFTDNATLTYLGSLIPGLSEEARYALVAGAIVGGGLTLIANAPNLVGFAMLRHHFHDGCVSPWSLLVAAIPPTLIAAACFWWL